MFLRTARFDIFLGCTGFCENIFLKKMASNTRLPRRQASNISKECNEIHSDIYIDFSYNMLSSKRSTRSSTGVVRNQVQNTSSDEDLEGWTEHNIIQLLCAPFIKNLSFSLRMLATEEKSSETTSDGIVGRDFRTERWFYAQTLKGSCFRRFDCKPS